MRRPKLPHLATRARDIQPFHVMDILARAGALEAQGRSIVHMEIGEPDFSTPEPIARAGIAAIEAGYTRYSPALGLPALREAIAGFYADRYCVEIAPARVIVTPGSSGALLLALGVLLNPRDELLLADPGYPCNRHFARFLDAHARNVPVGADSRYQLSPLHVAAHWREATRAALVASPANPTGMLLSLPELQALHEAVAMRGGTLIVDEIYHGLTYGCDAASALAVSDDVFVINSFSKYFGMTGWRLGWMVAPEAYVDAIERLAQNIFLAPPTPAQHAALAAFQPDTLAILEARRGEFMQRRDYLVPALRELGFDVPVTPEGAFYVYAGCKRFSDDSRAFADSLLHEAGVAITPGIDFGIHHAASHVRFAYTTSNAALREGVDRLAAHLTRPA